jgi:hypothetical protein
VVALSRISACSSQHPAILTCCPYQKEAPVPPLVELGHHAVDNVRFRRDYVYGVHVSYGLPPVFDALDVWEGQNQALPQQRGRILVMLRLRMSSSLTTLLMSFWLSSSTMSIFHYRSVVSEVWARRRVFVRRRG